MPDTGLPGVRRAGIPVRGWGGFAPPWGGPVARDRGRVVVGARDRAPPVARRATVLAAAAAIPGGRRAHPGLRMVCLLAACPSARVRDGGARDRPLRRGWPLPGS